MTDSIICPHCQHSIPLSEAISHQIESKYQLEIEALQKKADSDRTQLIELSKRRIEEEKEKTKKETEEQVRKKIADEMELKIKNTQNESDELKKEKKMLQEQLLEMNKTLRQLQDQTIQKELELTKKFNADQEKLRTEEQARAAEQFKLMLMEKDKKLQDILKVNEDLQRKIEQGSQQMQGEVLELAVEEILKKEFPLDDIMPVPKGINGADIIQTVKTITGKTCGTIIWETKRTKAWSHQWVPKLKDDQRKVHAELAVIVTQVPPDGIKRFGLVDGVWISEFDCLVGIAYALRNQVLEVSSVRSSLDGQKGKTEILYNYITSTDFKHRMEVIIEAFSGMQEEIEKERRWFAQKWAREERNLRKVLDSTVGMHGDLQSIMGKSIGDLKVAGELPQAIDADESRLF